MRVEQFDFELPEELIALRPASPRDSARLLEVEGARLDNRHVRDLTQILRAGDALVFNDTKVVPARLNGIRQRGEAIAHIEATLHMRTGADRWKAFIKPAKRVKEGEIIRFGADGGACEGATLDATVAEKGEAGEVLLVFDMSGPVLDERIAMVGQMPLPPYIAAKRPEDERDAIDYQTVYAKEEGAVAAPTAGLHFTPELLENLAAMGVEEHYVTLHVGAGTFLPVKVEDTNDHKMHSEWGEVDEATADALNAVKARGGRIVSVGTTSLRLLESAVDEKGRIIPWSGETDIFITPGYRFHTADMLMTNFHLPKSTLFMLVSAFAGFETMKRAYAHAIEYGYRFYSYGDSSLLYREDQ
ncbi:tRNA preQ1(34) S-adenosylmethionine ribosyltransferase-isomerase QueA [Nitratireductor basaltis]|uniref:S-adenosylmethionine:tRNA ribosyltransferase-isomerase n=1 Tax=Nitratireductor basaltis TaxID=472175 RepID=A0A084UB33_9HYPH|nr:tRNA preQ1(34) S-adenosylmethionine ribosyltransferase-isomerase QueA [Nitratireductor basaltis]KFB10169.1 S-adenosylmethionine:tRNA ribosyltransferase-isomerase [Nitratireductor basaltis]